MRLQNRTHTLELRGYQITGTANINLWGNVKSRVQMDKSFIPLDKIPRKTRLEREMIVSCINDGQFGCESILSANVEIQEVYELTVNNYEGNADYVLVYVPYRSLHVTLKTNDQILVNRGI